MELQTAIPHKMELPLSAAIDWTTNWRNLLKELGDSPMAIFQMIKAFNLSMGEIKIATTHDKNAPVEKIPVGVRLYFGSTTDDPKSLSDFKLIVVGVNHAGEDIVDKLGDFSNPCPNLCDPNSPLITGHS